MININVTNGTLPQSEIDYYVEQAQKKYPDKVITAIDLEVDGDYINAAYHFRTQPFERIRRITGYLVGTLDRFNDAKRSEESDRVKHTV
ncbi:MAG: anaerobic ribonucleoside-triphosphate reductase [Oscillospiraceae bacterium]